MSDMWKTGDDYSFKDGQSGGIGSCVTNPQKTEEVPKKKQPVEWYLKYDETEFLSFEQIEKTTTLYKCDEEYD